MINDLLMQLRALSSEMAGNAITAIMIAGAAFAIIVDWRSRPGYALGAVLVGTVVGMSLTRMGIPPGWRDLLTAIAVVTTPSTVLYFHKKTFLEALDELRDKLRNKPDNED